MNAEVEDWGGKQFGLRLAIEPDEIDRLIENFRVLRKDPDQHFHISAGGPEEPRVGDIEVTTLAPGQAHNMRVTSVALAPGTEVPDAGSRPRSTFARARALVIGSLWLGAVLAGSEALFRAYATYATNDYRPILVRGVWLCGVALIALHGATALSRTWKGRVPGIIAALLLLSVMGVLLKRLAAFR